MRSLVTILTFLSFCYPLGSVADESPSQAPEGTTIPFPAGKPGNKKDWVDNLQKNLPPLLCQQDRYFVQCFDITQKECVEFNQLLVQACLNNVAIGLPATLNEQDGEYWGQMVGRCAYDLYEKHMQSKKRNTSTCLEAQNPKSDLPKPSQAIP